MNGFDPNTNKTQSAIGCFNAKKLFAKIYVVEAKGFIKTNTIGEAEDYYIPRRCSWMVLRVGIFTKNVGLTICIHNTEFFNYKIPVYGTGTAKYLRKRSRRPCSYYTVYLNFGLI